MGLPLLRKNLMKNMTNSIYIYHHLGVGDSLFCNGLVRHFAETYDKVYVFCFPHNLVKVSYMYRDNPNIRMVPMEEPAIRSFMRINTQNKYLVLGHSPEYFHGLDATKEYTFEQGFYKMANVPFEYKWSKFYFERDHEKELEVFHRLGLVEGDKYAFIHDDPARDRNFKSELIDSSLKAIHPSEYQDISFWHFLYTIENAYEIHVHNSSFANIIDTMLLPVTDRLYYHIYARPDIGDQTFHKDVNWTFYK